MKKFDWKSYLHFSKKERNVIGIIIVIIAGIVATSIFRKPKEDTNTMHQFAQSLTDSVANITSRETRNSNNYNGSKTIESSALFEFDPNTLDENGWRKLGLPERNIHTIINYRNKGGKFRKPEDIKKIYGISEVNAEKLIPYIRVEGSNHQYSEGYHQNYSASYQNNYSPKNPSIIDINTATDEEWKMLPGIGDVLSKRIVKYRNAKGGFKTIDEVRKTYGISDSEFNVIRPYLVINESVSQNQTQQTTNTPIPQTLSKININTATEDEMRASRFIPYNIIKAILIYREQHNGFKSVDELKKIPFISDELYNKISPRLTVE